MIAFIVHNKADQVGVAVRDIRKGEKLEGWCMEDDSTVNVTAAQDIPLGHKIAIRASRKGEKVIKYGVSIGKSTEDIAVGGHVHTHNLRTERW